MRLPCKIRVKFRPSENMARYRGFGIDTDMVSEWVLPAEEAHKFVRWYPDNWLLSPPRPDNETLVSAVMCTCKGREDMARQAVMEFYNQDWKNKELVIVNQGDEWIIGCGKNIIEVKVSPTLNNGEMHNIGDGIASGAYIIRMDDDDLFSEDRFSEQLKAIKDTGATASTYRYYLTYIISEDVAVVQRFVYCPGLLMYRNEGLSYVEDIVKGSDSIFLQDYYGSELAIIDNAPEKYIRTYHGISQLSKRDRFGRYKRGARLNYEGVEVDWEYFEKRIKEIK